MEHMTKKQLIDTIIDAINDGKLNDKPVSEIHNEVFNTDFFITGRYQAEKWLTENGGVFNAIGEIRDYEMDNFGELGTDLSEPERVCNMYVYILGEEIINSMDFVLKNWDEKVNPKFLKLFKKELEKLKKG